MLKVGLEHTSTIDGLLWSFQPKTASQDRKALAQSLPLILKVLKNGMDSIGLPIEQQEAFLDDCFLLQTQALRAQAATSPAGPEASSLQEQPNQLLADEIRDGQLVLSVLDFTGIQAPPSPAPGYVVGDWLAFRKLDGETASGHVCTISPGSQRVLLINPDSSLRIAIHPGILDQQLRDGDACIRSARSLFDRAATRALRQTGLQ